MFTIIKKTTTVFSLCNDKGDKGKETLYRHVFQSKTVLGTMFPLISSRLCVCAKVSLLKWPNKHFTIFILN